MTSYAANTDATDAADTDADTDHGQCDPFVSALLNQAKQKVSLVLSRTMFSTDTGTKDTKGDHSMAMV